MALNPKKLARRALTAILGFLVLGLIVLYPPKWCFDLFLLAAGLVGIWELSRITEALGFPLYKTPPIALLILGFAGIYQPWISIPITAYLVVALTGLISLAPPSDMKKSLPRVGVTLTACAYFGLGLLGLAYIFHMPADDARLGRVLVAICLLTTWAGDTSAYIFGSMLGKHKIAPVASPKKSYEGTIANFAGNFLFLYLIKLSFLAELRAIDILLLGLVFGSLGFFGDLIESTWKRGSGIKDSGSVIPGHGGIMDRLDSVFLTAPIFYFYMKVFVFRLV